MGETYIHTNRGRKKHSNLLLCLFIFYATIALYLFVRGAGCVCMEHLPWVSRAPPEHLTHYVWWVAWLGACLCACFMLACAVYIYSFSNLLKNMTLVEYIWLYVKYIYLKNESKSTNRIFQLHGVPALLASQPAGQSIMSKPFFNMYSIYFFFRADIKLRSWAFAVCQQCWLLLWVCGKCSSCWKHQENTDKMLHFGLHYIKIKYFYMLNNSICMVADPISNFILIYVLFICSLFPICYVAVT